MGVHGSDSVVVSVYLPPGVCIHNRRGLRGFQTEMIPVAETRSQPIDPYHHQLGVCQMQVFTVLEARVRQKRHATREN